MTRRIFYDGLNLALEHGTGIATYCRMLIEVARQLEHKIGVVYGTPQSPANDPMLREIAFFDARKAVRISAMRHYRNLIADHFRCYLPVRPAAVNLSGAVVQDQFRHRLPVHDYLFAGRNLFDNAAGYFRVTGQFVDLAFDKPPDLFHWTYPMPIRAGKAPNIYTIHDLVPLRLPFTTLDNKRHMLRMLRKIAATADHIVTVSENSRRDIVELLGVDERKVTNTYQAVEFPREYAGQSEDEVAEHLAGSFGLDYRNYLLFFGALEPKKNVDRLIEAYFASGVDLPLVLIAGGGWQNEATLDAIAAHNAKGEMLAGRPLKRRVIHYDFVSVGMLVTMIMGARAVLAPSLYEGFGLAVLEAMLLGTPVITSRGSSLPEIAGEAALLVDPYEPADIARAIRTIVEDDDLRAELSRRGRVQAANFSVERYRERIKSLYVALA